MNETSRMRIVVTSSLNEISANQLGKREGDEEGGVIPCASPLSTAGIWRDKIKTT